MIDNKILKEMLDKIPDPKSRKFYAGIINGSISKEIKCMGDKCNGRVVGYIDAAGRIIEKNNEDFEKVGCKYGISDSRMRTDGVLGFRCWCGNESIRSPEEDKVFGKSPKITAPTQEELERIFEMTNARKKGYKEKRFIVQDIKR